MDGDVGLENSSSRDLRVLIAKLGRHVHDVLWRTNLDREVRPIHLPSGEDHIRYHFRAHNAFLAKFEAFLQENSLNFTKTADDLNDIFADWDQHLCKSRDTLNGMHQYNGSADGEVVVKVVADLKGFCSELCGRLKKIRRKLKKKSRPKDSNDQE